MIVSRLQLAKRHQITLFKPTHHKGFLQIFVLDVIVEGIVSQKTLHFVFQIYSHDFQTVSSQ